MGNTLLSEESIRTAKKVTTIVGSVTVGASTGMMSLSTIFGVVLGVLARFFQVVEFTGLLVFFNIDFDLIIETLLNLIHNIGDFDVIDFPFENTMKN